MPEFRKRPTRRAQQLRNNATGAERRLWSQLSRRQVGGHKFSRQMPVGSFICDFLCRERSLIVEVDGGQHCENPQDAHRTVYLQKHGYRVIRFWNNEVLENLDGVVERIAEELTKEPTPNPLPQAAGGLK